MELMTHQLEAIDQLGNGKVLWGGVGVGKSATVIGYYVKAEAPRDIVVITTAKKRDSLDWEGEFAKFGIGYGEGQSLAGQLEVNSWNNIHKYEDVEDAFFIFDEQRIVGNGAWVKSFLKIARKNRWVLLSATPGDTWLDYAPIFIANGFYKNITDFKRQHVLYEPYVKYPKIKGYLSTQKLEVLRNDILVEMPYMKNTTRYLNYIPVGYNKTMMDELIKKRWNWLEDRPVKDAAELFRLMRRILNSDPSRLDTVRGLLKFHPKLIVFYNFDYELEILRTLADEYRVYEWNGHIKHHVLIGDSWVYLVQYVAGAEAWECTSTDAMCLYSLTYSYKNFIQAQGRIDRLNNTLMDLYYYILMSNFRIDWAIKSSLDKKKDFNWKRYMDKSGMLVSDSGNVVKSDKDARTDMATLEPA